MTFWAIAGRALSGAIIVFVVLCWVLGRYYAIRSALRRRGRDRARKARHDVFETSVREFHDLLAYADAGGLPMIVYAVSEGAVLRIGHTTDMSTLPPCGRCGRHGWERFRRCFCPRDDMTSNPLIDVFSPIHIPRF